MWELLKRHRVNQHPCYRIGWNRCSCAVCILSTPRLFKGFSELFPHDFAELRHDEEILGFTLENKKNLEQFIESAESCVVKDDKQALHSILTGKFRKNNVIVDVWKYPAGAFHGADGGSC